MKIWRFLKERILEYGDQLISDDNYKSTYREFLYDAEILATKLKCELCCAILCDSEFLAAKALIGCFAAGVTAVPLSLRYGEQHCEKILDYIQPTAVITDTNGTLNIVRMSGNYVTPDLSPALIMCTSGTTGVPKGVMLSETNVMANLKDIAAYFDLTANDTILIARPLYHCAVLTGEFLVSLIKGVHICFRSLAFNPKDILEIISKNEITVFAGTPTMFSMLIKFAKRPIKNTLRIMCVSGEYMGSKMGMLLAEYFPNVDIYHVYGLTEASPRVSYLPPALFRHHPESVGYPLDSIQLKIVDSKGSMVKANEDGLLWICGDSVTEGYFNNPKQTKKAINNGWLCTGDIAKMDEKGLLYIKGRMDDLIIRAGMNIYPQEIENVLRRDFRVNDVFVYGYMNPILGNQIGMKISGNFTNIKEVKKMCNELLPEFQIPTKIEIVDYIAKNGSGKIIRK